MDETFRFVDPRGFIALDAIARVASRATADSFALAYPAPSLLIRSAGGEAAPPHAVSSDETEGWLRRTTDPDAGEAPPGPVYERHVAFIRKRPNANPFAQMVTVGRAINNDLVISLGTVSKFHGYFLEEKGTWSFVDAASRNGTAVDGVRLKPNVKHALVDGASLKIGKEVVAEFYGPRALFAQLGKC